jgi:hypothetical protein
VAKALLAAISTTHLSWTLPPHPKAKSPERTTLRFSFFSGPFPAMKTWHLCYAIRN